MDGSKVFKIPLTLARGKILFSVGFLKERFGISGEIEHFRNIDSSYFTSNKKITFCQNK